MEKASLPQLNDIFGTAARAHEFDPAWLVGTHIRDVLLAGVIGVKGVIIPNALTRIWAQHRPEPELRIDGLMKGWGYGEPTPGDVIEDFALNHWHADAIYKQDAALSEVRIEPHLLRVLANFGSTDTGTWLALGNVRRYTHLTFRDCVTKSIEDGLMKRVILPRNACLALPFGKVSGPDKGELRFAASMKLGVHSAPQTKPRWRLPFGPARRILIKDFHKRSITEPLHYAP